MVFGKVRNKIDLLLKEKATLTAIRFMTLVLFRLMASFICTTKVNRWERKLHLAEDKSIKSPYNPISNSGHEICVWPYNGGVAALITTDGPEKNTIQWAPDGINFEIMSVIPGVTAHAIGLNRTADNEKEPTEILRWGLSHMYNSWDYQSIMSFTSERKTQHRAKGE